MNFADYLQKLLGNPRTDKLNIYNMDYTTLLFALHTIVSSYANRVSLAPKDFPIPMDVIFRRSKTKVSIRCSFCDISDSVALSNVIGDLKMERFTSLLDGEAGSTVIELGRVFANDAPVETAVPEIG